MGKTMGENSKIAWCDHTHNFWIGCTRISPACDHCYAETYGHRFGVRWGNHPRRRTSDANSKKLLSLHRKALARGVREKVFTNSLADFFDNQVDSDWRESAWRDINECNGFDWLILTKRPQNIVKMLPMPCGWSAQYWPWPHVWIGTTVENNEEANRRIPHLLKVPSKVRFLSCEPMLEELFLLGWLLLYGGIDWVIAGAESGPHRRHADVAWFRSLRDQCASAGVPFFMKQMEIGGNITTDMALFPPDLRIREFPGSLRAVSGRKHRETSR